MTRKYGPRPQVLALENPRFSPKVYWGTRFLLVPVLLLSLALTAFLASMWSSTPLYHGAGFLPYSKLLTTSPLLKPPPMPSVKPKVAKLPPLKERQKHYWPMVRRLALQYGLEPSLVMAVIHVESRFKPNAVSRKGAMGLMQIVPLTADHLGLTEPMDPESNVEAGVRYLAQLKKLFEGDLVLALAAYNAGPTKVMETGKVPELKETRQYLVQVQAMHQHFKERFQKLRTMASN